LTLASIADVALPAPPQADMRAKGAQRHRTQT